MSGFPAGTAAAEGLACCHVCLKLAPAALHHCPRCRAALHLHRIARRLGGTLLRFHRSVRRLNQTFGFACNENGKTHNADKETD